MVCNWFPQIRVTGRTRDEGPGKLLFVSVVNGVVGPERTTNEVLRVQNVWIEVPQIINGQWVHVVDVDASVNWEVAMTELMPVVSDHHFVTNVLPPT